MSQNIIVFEKPNHNLSSLKMLTFFTFVKELETLIDAVQIDFNERTVIDQEKSTIDFMTFLMKNCHHFQENTQLLSYIRDVINKLYNFGSKNTKDFLHPYLYPQHRKYSAIETYIITGRWPKSPEQLSPYKYNVYFIKNLY